MAKIHAVHEDRRTAEVKRRIVALVRRNPNITVRQLASELDLSYAELGRVLPPVITRMKWDRGALNLRRREVA